MDQQIKAIKDIQAAVKSLTQDEMNRVLQFVQSQLNEEFYKLQQPRPVYGTLPCQPNRY